VPRALRLAVAIALFVVCAAVVSALAGRILPGPYVLSVEPLLLGAVGVGLGVLFIYAWEKFRR
jgi:hypothetical protein